MKESWVDGGNLGLIWMFLFLVLTLNTQIRLSDNGDAT